MSFLIQTCPHCDIEICVREIRHQGIFKTFRVCPGCGGSFTVDTSTKYRQTVCIFISVVSLVFTLLLYFRGSDWVIPAIASYVVLGLIIYWGNKRVFFVPYQENQNITKDT